MNITNATAMRAVQRVIQARLGPRPSLTVARGVPHAVTRCRRRPHRDRMANDCTYDRVSYLRAGSDAKLATAFPGSEAEIIQTSRVMMRAGTGVAVNA